MNNLPLEELTPARLFVYLTDHLCSMAAGRLPAPDDHVKFYVAEKSQTCLSLACMQATDDEFQSMLTLRNRVKYIPCPCDSIVLTLGHSDHEYLSIRTRTSPGTGFKANGGFYCDHRQAQVGVNFMYYGPGKFFCRNENNPTGKLWPCTMKDLFQPTALSQRCFCYLLMAFLGQAHPLWTDLAQDFLAGSAYSSIPAAEIWASPSRSELLRRHYGFSLNRNNQETIGQGIFLAQARKLVKENELQLLFGFRPGHIYIGRKRSDLKKPLSEFILQNCPDATKAVNVGHGRTLFIDQRLIEDAIAAEIVLRRKFSISPRSASNILSWHDDAHRILRCREAAIVKIPLDSKFKRLKLPENCVRLTSRRQFVEEGDFQNNCITSYIPYVNNDTASIWSMRKEDGTRNTIEIRCRRSKNNPQGYFYINEIRAFANSDPEEAEVELIRKSLARQVPYSPVR